MMKAGLSGAPQDREVKKVLSLKDRIDNGEVMILPVETFWRDPKRKEREPWSVYKRSMRNFNKARKARLRGGPGASLLLDKVTLKIIW